MSVHPAVERIAARVAADEGCADIVGLLARRMSRSDLTSLLMEVENERSSRVLPSDLMRQYEQDRFVAPAVGDTVSLLELQTGVLRQLQPMFEPVTLAPVAPLGSCSVVSAVPQNNLVSTTRGNEVLADPTNSMALEAAARRRHSSSTVRLAATSRVVRAQTFDGPLSYAHFALLGLVSAGRDPGHKAFEAEEVTRHIKALCRAARLVTTDPIIVRLSTFDDRFSELVDQIVAAVATDRVVAERSADRVHGRGYYSNLCFKLVAARPGGSADSEVEFGDGGIVDWTQQLLGNKKERLMISGLGLERLLTLA